MIQKQKETKKRSKQKRANHIAKSLDEKQGKTLNTTNEPPTTKLECKHYYQECRRVMDKTWDLVSETDSIREEEGITTPSNFKTYTIQDQRIVTQSFDCERPKNTRESYDGPKEVKQIDLAQPKEEPKPVYIATNLQPPKEELLIQMLKQYRDAFAWSYKDLKGVESSVCKHTIPMRDDAKPSRQRPYTYNDTFAKKIKMEIDKLLATKLIYEIEHI